MNTLILSTRLPLQPGHEAINMMTKEEATVLVRKKINAQSLNLPDDDEIIILEQDTIDKPWGWIFFYTSRKWYETNDIDYAIAGNAPIIVEKETGKLYETGTAYSIEHYIENYEKYGDPHR